MSKPRQIQLARHAYDIYTGEGENQALALVSGPVGERTWLFFPDLDAAEALRTYLELGIRSVREDLATGATPKT